MIVLAKGNFILHSLEVLRKLNIKRDKDGQIVTEDFNSYLNTLNKSFQCISDSGYGSLNKIDNLEFADNVIANPPFVSDGTGAGRKEMSDGMKEFYSNCGFYKEGMFVRYIIKSLKKGGEGIVILPFGVLSRNKDKSRTDLLKNCHVKALISLPRRLFDNTDWKTYIVCFQRKMGDSEKYRKPVFIYNVENVGFTLDANRIECETDLEDLVDRYNRYIKEGADSIDITSKRCRTINQEEFAKLTNWEEPFRAFDIANKIEKVSIADSLNQVNLLKDRLNTLIDDLSINLEEQNKDITYQTKKLGDTFCFQFYKSMLGFTQKEYIPIDTKNEQDIPIFTAKLNPVAFIQERPNFQPFQVNEEKPHVSVASDGDGTAGTNIVLHTKPYYINTSRIAFEIICEDILPEYVFYAIKDIKTRYKLDYSNKCNLTTLQDVEIEIPVKRDEHGQLIEIYRLKYTEDKKTGEITVTYQEDYLYDVDKQQLFVNNSKNIEVTKDQIDSEIQSLMDCLTNINLTRTLN